MNTIITHARIATKELIVLLVVITMLSQCNTPEEQTEKETEYRKELSNTLYSIREVDSLQIVLQKFIEERNELGQMICYKQLGNRQRENASFSDAIASHQKSLVVALKLNDTVEIVQAMNNLGTNFRRIGAQSEASQYHYQALNYAEAWSGLNTSVGAKNRVVALNGIGNISLTLGYYNDAEENFREAER